MVFGCKDENTMVRLSVSFIEKHIDRLNISKDEDGLIKHWHIGLFKDVDGKMTWMMSKPDIEELNIESFIL